MKRFGILLKLNIKKAIHWLPQQFIGAIALIFIVGAIAFCGGNFLTSVSSNISTSPLNLAVVMYDDSLMANSISQTITSNDKLSEAIAFDFVDENTALDGLEQGSYIAAIIIEKGTVDSILDGTNTPIHIVFPKNSGLEAIVIKEIADAAATLLGSAQAGIYSMCDIYDEYGASSQINSALFSMNLKYISFVLGASSLFEVNEVSATSSLSLITYYTCAGIVLFMMLFSINYFPITDKLPSVLSKKMSSEGLNFILQESASYIAILVAQLTTLILIALPAVPILSIFNISIDYMHIGYLILILFIFTLVASSFVYAISRISSHNISRIMLAFFLALIMSFVSGCFVPTAMLPEAIQIIDKAVPTTHMLAALTTAMTGHNNLTAILCCLGFGAILFFIGSLASYIHLRKELR